MNEVSTNLPVIAQSSVNPKDETVKTYYRPEISYDNSDVDLERIPEADYVELNPALGESPKVLMAVKMPNPQEVTAGIGAATSILIGLKSFFEAAGDLWKTIKDNFQTHKNEEMVKQAYKQMAEQRALEYREAA